MQSDRPTWTRALLKGSLWHFLASFVIPILVIGVGVGLSVGRTTGKITADGVLFFVTLSSIVLGTIFLFHEVVLLIAVVVERRRRLATQPETDVALDLLMAVICSDLIALMLLFAWLASKGENMREMLSFFLLPAVGFYGVYLFGCSVREVLPQPAPPESPPTGASAQPGNGLFSRPKMPGLQIYVTAATAWLAFGAVGWPRDWFGGFGIALVSVIVGRGVERMVVRWNQRQGGTNTGP
jgi:hypothetical protein